jgi:hypothetical protein
MSSLSASELVDLIVKRAPDLRKAGVLDITIDGFQAKLAPHQESVPIEQEKRGERPVDPLVDPHTYGLAAGERIPGLSHLEVIDGKPDR